MKSDTQENELDLGIHQKSFDQQSSTTKELELLNEKIEKTTGQETNLLQQLILIKSEEAISLGPESESFAVPALKISLP
jgi:hypothetical protein